MFYGLVRLTRCQKPTLFKMEALILYKLQHTHLQKAHLPEGRQILHWLSRCIAFHGNYIAGQCATHPCRDGHILEAEPKMGQGYERPELGYGMKG